MTRRSHDMEAWQAFVENRRARRPEALAPATTHGWRLILLYSENTRVDSRLRESLAGEQRAEMKHAQQAGRSNRRAGLSCS